MNYILYALTVIILASCTQNNESEVSNKQVDTLNLIKTKSEKYILTEASGYDYQKAKEYYNDRILYDTTEIHKINGQFKLPFYNNTSFITFTDTLQNTDSEDMRRFDYIGQFEDIGIYIVEGNFWEHYECYLIDQLTGEQTTIWNTPKLSPNSKYISNLSMSYGLEGVENGLQIWEIKSNKDHRTINSKIAIDQDMWIPIDLVWEENKSLILKAIKIDKYIESNGKPKDDDYYYQRLIIK